MARLTLSASHVVSLRLGAHSDALRGVFDAGLTVWRFRKHVRSFSDVPQLPDTVTQFLLVTCHWLSE